MCPVGVDQLAGLESDNVRKKRYSAHRTWLRVQRSRHRDARCEQGYLNFEFIDTSGKKKAPRVRSLLHIGFESISCLVQPSWLEPFLPELSLLVSQQPLELVEPFSQPELRRL